MESEKELAAVHNEAKLWTLKAAISDFPIPIHPGAIKYFKEANVWTPELEKTQQELLKSF
jgi:TRAP-type uncharacterized transport system substrate-binding protein